MKNGENGIQIFGYAYLPYSSEILSTAPIPGSDDALFHRQESHAASLSYYTSPASVNQLGINGLEGNQFDIHSYAYYNVSLLDAASAADELVWELAFYPKEEHGTDYSNAAVMVPYQVASPTLTINGGTPIPGSNAAPFSFSSLNPKIPIERSIPLSISTGEALGAAHWYSNYKVKLTVYLKSGGNEISGSRAEDYIIYTNAKILTSLVQR